MNPDDIIQLALWLTSAAIIGLVTDHIIIRTKLSTFVTQEKLAHVESRLHDKFAEIARDLRKIAGDLEYLRGKSGG